MMNSKLLYFFSLFFIHLCCVYSLNSTHKCSDEQRDALLLFKQNISYSNDYSDPRYYNCKRLPGSGNHPITINWNRSIDCYHWNGVKRNHLGDVIGLDLRCGMLKGVLELFTLFSRLPHLEALDLSYNSLSVVTNNVTDNVTPDFRVLRLAYCELNVFPQFLRALKSLQLLDLAGNNIHGFIPDWAGEVGGNKLVYLDFSDNSITGLSLYQWSGLEHLYLQSNMIRGQFPTTICNNMTHLKYLDMSNNSFYGVIPQCFENITSSLLMINLGLNNFTGAIPNVSENCRLSEGLILNYNQFKGDVPRSLLRCQYLKVLDLGNNKLKGRFPRWLDLLTKLEVLILRSNNLHGAIETSSTMGFPFSRVKIFDISNNDFVGPLPGEYFKSFDAIKDVERIPNINITNTTGSYYSIRVTTKGVQLLFPQVDWLGPQIWFYLSVIDLSDNKFEGEIPNVIGSLNSLIVLNLSHNNLSGQIPHELGNLFAVESLDLSWNQLSGEIPQSLAEIRNLEVLNLSQNHLEGRIPEGIQFNTFEESSFGGNLGLCGMQIYKHCDDRNMIPVQVDNDHGDDGMFPWEVVVLGYGCGTLLGFMMGYRMLSTGKPKWFTAIYNALERMIPIRRKKKKCVNTKKRNHRSNGRKF